MPHLIRLTVILILTCFDYNPNYQSKIRVWNSYLVCTEHWSKMLISSRVFLEQSCTTVLLFLSDRFICEHGYDWIRGVSEEIEILLWALVVALA